MFFTALLFTVAIAAVDAFSSGLSPLCDAKSDSFGCTKYDMGIRKYCLDTPAPIMPWVRKPVLADDVYELSAGDEDAPSTSYTPNEFFAVNLRVKKYDRRYSGILLYAVNDANEKVGEWQTIDSKPLFHGHCPKSILHAGIEPKPYLTTWMLRVPAGSGRIRFHALIKEGGPNLGEFWYPNELTLSEGAAGTSKVRFVAGEPGQSCNEVCAPLNKLCVQSELDALNNGDALLSRFKTMSPVCRMPLFLRCNDGPSGPLQSDDRFCAYTSAAQCAMIQQGTPAAAKCDAKPADAGERRLCPCEQDPSKPALTPATTAAPVVTVAPPATTVPKPAVGLPPCTPQLTVDCACKTSADCGSNRCYVGRCIPNKCLYGEIGCPCELETSNCATGLTCDQTKHCVRPMSNKQCQLNPGEVGCQCTEDAGGCNSADLVCSEAYICVRPVDVCAPGSKYCSCVQGVCDPGLECFRPEAQNLCVIIEDGPGTQASAASHVLMSLTAMLVASLLCAF